MRYDLRCSLSVVMLMASSLAGCADGDRPSDTPGDGGGGAEVGLGGGGAGDDGSDGTQSDGGSTSSAPSNGGGSQGGGGSGDGGAHANPAFPVPDWTMGDPAQQGMDPASLQAALDAAEAEESHCLVVVRHGVIVAEGYWQGKDASSRDKSFSVAKSYTSALVGIAIERGDIQSLDQSAADFIPEWQGTPHEAVTIRHLLSMQSGLEWSVMSDYVQMATLSTNQTEYAIDLDQSEDPGTSWRYHNGGVQIFEAVFRGATGMSIEEYAQAHLWSRIGSSPDWNQDFSGHPTTYAHVKATCRDHARFGYLYLRGGNWADGPVVPGAWVEASLTPSQDQNRAYGFLWWLNGQTPALDPFNEPKESTIAPFAPADLFAARGFGDQFIDVIPSLDLVVVRIGPDPIGFNFDWNQLSEDENASGTHEAILAPILESITE